MQLEVRMTSAAMESTGDEKAPGRLRAWSRLSPFAAPWSPLARLTGGVLVDGRAVLAHGRLLGDEFLVDAITSVDAFDDAALRAGPAYRRGEPVCMLLPRGQTLARHFRIPADDDAEIEAILPHLLAGELPMALDHYVWVWTSLSDARRGGRTVTVHVARADRLAEESAPLSAAGLNVLGFVPEGWAWAHALRGTTDDEPVRCLVVPGDRGPYLVAVSDGVLLYDALLPERALTRAADDGAWALDWDGPDLKAARVRFEEIVGAPLPEPEVWGGGGHADPHHDARLAAHAAASALVHERLLAPATAARASRRRTVLRTLRGAAVLGVLGLALWAGVIGAEDRRLRARVSELDVRLTEEAPRVAALAEQADAVRRASRTGAGGEEALLALESLRRDVAAEIRLEHLSYTRGRTVTVRGAAPNSAAVLGMAEILSGHPLWRGWRVTQMRAENVEGRRRVHFVAEGEFDAAAVGGAGEVRE